MKITLLISTFNSTSQQSYAYLKEKGHSVDVVYARDEEQMLRDVEEFHPDIILSPFLKKFVPASLYNHYPTYILHPGIVGDKGAYSLENAILEEREHWGIVYLRANDVFDGGAIYVEEPFRMRKSTKASLYRNEVNQAAFKALQKLLINIENPTFEPLPQLPTSMHKTITQKERAIVWEHDTTEEIIKKIYMSDSHPGVLDEILGVACYLYGAHKEERLRGDGVKEILAKRDGAICVSTKDGALWITHLKEVGKFKLPATYVLKERLKGVKEERLSLIFDRSYSTFYEISCEIKEDVAYLHFNFHNGAFSSEQCIKLKYAFEYIKSQVKVVVLMGGVDFFSNGIHLNILEDSKKNGEDGWSNINAMNDLVKSVLFAEDVITVASVSKNAGAGGVFLALACDYVLSTPHVVLNPHYKTLGLSGSEYHTYTLVKRVGKEKAQEILEGCLPLSANKAEEIGVVDHLLSLENYREGLASFCEKLLEDEEQYEDYIWEKEESLEQNRFAIEEAKEAELKQMHPEFWDEASSFHTLRYEFVYKVCPLRTPKRLKAIINE